VGPGLILKAHGNGQGSRNNNSTLLGKYRKSFQPDVLQYWGHHESLTVIETSQQLLGKSQRGSSRLLTLRLAVEVILAQGRKKSQ